MTPEELLSKLDEIDLKIRRYIEKLPPDKLSVLLQNETWNDFLKEVGLAQWIKEYGSMLDFAFVDTLSGFGKVDQIAKDIETIKASLDLIKASNERTIVGYLTGNSENIRSKLIQSVVNGTTQRKTIKNILETNPLHTRAQLGTVINTSYADFGRSTVRQAFEGEEVRFEYVGGVIPTSSQQCEWLMNNQKPEGYTMAEIDAGIQTPFGIIDWNGRQPNFNCIHAWQPKD